MVVCARYYSLSTFGSVFLLPLGEEDILDVVGEGFEAAAMLGWKVVTSCADRR